MSLYPTTPLPNGIVNWNSLRPVTISKFIGRVVSRADCDFDLVTMDFTYLFASWSEAKTVLNFWNTVGGANGVFTFRDFTSRAWDALFVAVATAGQTVFDLPVTSGVGHVVYVNGTPGSPTIGAGTGTEGRDKATFGSGLTAGQIVTLDITSGLRTAYARFDLQAFPWQDPVGDYFLSGQIRLAEVR